MEKIFDKTEAVQKAGGKVDLAKELFKMLLVELPKLQQSMNEAYKAQEIEPFRDHAHKIHGATAYCGVPALRQHAHILESAIKSQRALADMQHELQQLNQAINTLIEVGESELNSDWL